MNKIIKPCNSANSIKIVSFEIRLNKVIQLYIDSLYDAFKKDRYFSNVSFVKSITSTIGDKYQSQNTDDKGAINCSNKDFSLDIHKNRHHNL